MPIPTEFPKKPGPYDFIIQRGSSTPVSIRLNSEVIATCAKTPDDLTGSIVTLEIKWPGGRLLKTSADGGLTLDIPNGGVTWTPTADETNMIQLGKSSNYEFRVVWPSGNSVPYLRGYMIGDGIG